MTALDLSGKDMKLLGATLLWNLCTFKSLHRLGELNQLSKKLAKIKKKKHNRIRNELRLAIYVSTLQKIECIKGI